LQELVVRLSYLEIYQEQIKDLLNPDTGSLDVFYDEKRVPPMWVGRFEGMGIERKRVEGAIVGGY